MKKNVNSSELSRHEVSRCAECTAFNLKKATRIVQNLFDEAFKPIGLEGTQYTVLGHIFVHEPISLTKLADLMHVDRTTLARNLKPLEKKKLVEIRPGSDRRARIINITKRGKEALSQALPLWENTQQEIKTVLGIDNWGSMISNLNGLVEELEQR